MALSRYTIQMNYDKALRQAEELEDIAENLRVAANSLNQEIQNVSSCWNSTNSQSFFDKAAVVHEDLYGQEVCLLGVASSIRYTAQAIYNAEMENLEIAESRNY